MVARTDLLNNPDCHVKRTATSAPDGTPLTLYDLDLDVRQARTAGWHRIKFIAPAGHIHRVRIEGRADAQVPAWDRLTRQAHTAFYLYIGSSVSRVRLAVYVAQPDDAPFTASLRRLHPLEYVWRSNWRAFARRPLNYMRHFRNPVDPFIITYDFPAPALSVDDADAYASWMAGREQEFERRLLLRLGDGAEPPQVAILMPVCDPDLQYLRAAVDSVKRQTSPHWHLCIADDASNSPAVRTYLQRLVGSDPRIRITFRGERGHISKTTNDAFALSDAPLVTCLDHDDVLAPRAVEFASRYFLAHPSTQLLYSDEDKIDQYGNRYLPYFKPDFSPELLRSYNYINHLTVHRRSNIQKVGGWRSEFDGAQDYDLLLRTMESIPPETVRHLPCILYHWRAIAGSAALDVSYKPYALVAGRRALQGHFARREVSAEVEASPSGRYEVRYRVRGAPAVSIIIPTRNKASLLRACVESVRRRTTYPHREIVVVDNGSDEPDALELLDQIDRAEGVRVLRYPGPFNYSAINNFAVGRVTSDFVCLLNNDMEVIAPDWLTDMLGYATQPGVGCVGAKLLYEGRSVQHAGVILGLGGVAGHAFLRTAEDAPGYFGRAVVPSNWSALTGACLLVRRAIYQEVSGLDENELPIAFNDIDFCIKVRDAGYRNILVPSAKLFHYESVSRGAEDTPEKQARFNREVGILKSRYGSALNEDPFYSPHLRLDDDFAIRTERLAA